MRIIELKEIQNDNGNIKLGAIYEQFRALLLQLEKKELSLNFIKLVNQEVEELNNTLLIDDKLKKLIKQKQTIILKLAEKEFKIVPVNYYRNLLLVLGMTVFGLPIGVVFGLIIGNLGLLSLGLPIGMGIGIAIGLSMDKKAFQEGRQLAIEIKH